MAVARIPDGLRVGASLIVEPGATIQGFSRASLDQQSLSAVFIPWHAWRVWDSIATNLPSAGANDDLGLLGNTFGTGSPTIETGDLKAAGATTRYARAQVALPLEYDAAADVVLRFHAGMKTTVSDGTATIDVQAYRSDTEGGVGSDLVTTAATTINSLTLADKDFVVSAGTLSAGDVLDLRVAIAINDTATATAVIGQIGAAWLLCDTRG